MKANCDLTRDLLPLYVEGLCGETSVKLVNEHVELCPDCSRMLEGLRVPEKVSNDNDTIMKAAAPLRKIHKKQIVILTLCMAINAVIVTWICCMLFMVGWTASTRQVDVRNVEMLDEMTFSVTAAVNKETVWGYRLISGMTISRWDDSGNVYLSACSIFAWPSKADGAYTMSFGFDREALGCDGIRAIYLTGGEEGDTKLIWSDER